MEVVRIMRIITRKRRRKGREVYIIPMLRKKRKEMGNLLIAGRSPQLNPLPRESLSAQRIC